MSKKSRVKDLYQNVKYYIEFTENTSVSKEFLSGKFKARTHEVHNILQQLNLEGLVSQPVHHTCCWSPLDGHRRCSVWNADYYLIRKEKQDDE